MCRKGLFLEFHLFISYKMFLPLNLALSQKQLLPEKNDN